MAIQRIPSSSLLGGLFDSVMRGKMRVSRVPGKRHNRRPNVGRRCRRCHNHLTPFEKGLRKVTQQRLCCSCRGLNQGREIYDAQLAEQKHRKAAEKKRYNATHTCTRCGQVKKIVQERGTSSRGLKGCTVSPDHKERFCGKCWNAYMRQGVQILAGFKEVKWGDRAGKAVPV